MGRYPFGGWESTSGYSDPTPKGEGYDVAQICLNGHEVNATTIRNPHMIKPYCEDCGEKTITACPSCNAAIQGFFWGGGGFSYYVPKHCHQCGKPCPWTESKRAAALEFFAEELDMKAEEQREELKHDLDALAADQPRTQVAALRIKRLLGKVGRDAAGMARDILKDIISETARKVIYPDGK